MTSQTKSLSRKPKKNANLTIDLLSLGVYAPGPQVLPTDPKFCGKFESELHSGLRARNRELKGSGVLGSEGDNSPFRGARPKPTSYSDSPFPKPHSTHFLVPTYYSDGFTEPNSISAREGVSVPAGNRNGVQIRTSCKTWGR